MKKAAFLVFGPLAFLAAPARADDLIFFRAPSGNINCLLATGDYPEARCDMRALTPSYTTAPEGCELDWGASFGIGPSNRKGYLVCAGDTVITSDALVLDYGKSLTLGSITCTSEKTGMTCTNPAGHGFTIAKAKQRLF